MSIREATSADVDDICALIIGLADYEQLAHEVVWQRADIEAALFGPVPAAHVLLAIDDQNTTTAGFALWYPTFSTFLGQRGIWLEDLFVKPEARGAGHGLAVGGASGPQAWGTGSACADKHTVSGMKREREKKRGSSGITSDMQLGQTPRGDPCVT